MGKLAMPVVLAAAALDLALTGRVVLPTKAHNLMVAQGMVIQAELVSGPAVKTAQPVAAAALVAVVMMDQTGQTRAAMVVVEYQSVLRGLLLVTELGVTAAMAEMQAVQA
jgi:hypothetical protein